MSLIVVDINANIIILPDSIRTLKKKKSEQLADKIDIADYTIINENESTQLQRVQNSALRIATGCLKMADVTELHQEAQELPVHPSMPSTTTSLTSALPQMARSLQPNRYSQGRPELYWHNCAPGTAESLVNTWTESIWQRTTIATTVVIRLQPDTHHLFDSPAKPTKLTVESSWSASTDTAKNHNLVINETS